MRQTPVNDYLEEISTELPEELYGNLSDAIYETVCEFDEEVAQLKAENAMLREQLAKARDPQRIGGTADPESFVYAIEQLREFRWQHATNDEEAIPYINNVVDAHERENAKLRDLALNCYRMAKAHCTDKDCRTRCSHWPECCEHDSLQHAVPCELAVLACELGVEVNE